MSNTHETLARPEDITSEEYDTLYSACEKANAGKVYSRLIRYVSDLDVYAGQLEQALALEQRANRVAPEPGNIKEDLAEVRRSRDAAVATIDQRNETIRQLTAELAGAQTRLAAIGLLLR